MSVRIELLPDPVRRDIAIEGGITCEQEALITVDRETFRQIWTPSTLELLARTYWHYIQRRTLGLIRITSSGDAQVVALFGRLPLLRFRPAVLSTGDQHASVEWPIEKGLLVARDGRERGYLKIAVEREPGGDESSPKLRVSSTVSNFYPWIRGAGWFARIGTWIYAQTQLRIHIAVTKGFLRSLDGLPAEVIRQGAGTQD